MCFHGVRFYFCLPLHSEETAKATMLTRKWNKWKKMLPSFHGIKWNSCIYTSASLSFAVSEKIVMEFLYERLVLRAYVCGVRAFIFDFYFYYIFLDRIYRKLKEIFIARSDFCRRRVRFFAPEFHHFETQLCMAENIASESVLNQKVSRDTLATSAHRSSLGNVWCVATKLYKRRQDCESRHI